MIIGITGGIGSGKSTIANELARRGYVVYDCDQAAKRIISENPDVQQEIIDLLGEEAFIYTPYTIHHTPIYNTQYVAKRVFAEPELLEKLNAIIHPEVALDILAKQPDFVESAILYEAGLDKICSKIIVVQAPEEVRIARTIGRDYKGDACPENINKVRARICAQGEYEYPTLLPTLYINNDGKTPIPEIVEKITQWMCKN